MHKNVNKFIDLIRKPIFELIALANSERDKNGGDDFEFCSIVNAKSGQCSEDCKYCAQSSFYSTDVVEYALMSEEELVACADEAVINKADRFSFVTSGHGPTQKDIDVISSATIKIKKKYPDLNICASLGILSDGSLKKLNDAGISRYHHNVETSAEFYSEVVSTHTYENRVKTIDQARKLGFDICSGGIIGMGESWEDRISMALELKDLDVDGIPLNFLMPIEGTPLADVEKLKLEDVLRTIAIFKIINPTKMVRIIAGREAYLKDSQIMAFLAGASSMMIGGYLTIDGRKPEDDHELLANIKNLWKNN